MDDENDRRVAREPEVGDLVKICRSLNENGARYALIGGFALIAHGGARTTKDIDLLVDPSPENIARTKRALAVLEDNAAAELADDDVARYAVCRVADEVIVDLLARACSVTYEQAQADMEWIELEGVRIPVVSKRTLLATKETVRPQDAADRQLLEWLIHAEEENK